MVGVDQYPVLRPSPPDCHQQCIQHNGPVQGGLHRPADHRPGVKIENHRQIQPAFPGPDIGDVGHPSNIGLLDRKFPLQAAGRESVRLSSSISGLLVSSQRLDPVLPHQARHSMLAAGLAVFPGVAQYPRAAVTPLALLVEMPNLVDQALVLKRPHRHGSPSQAYNPLRWIFSTRHMDVTRNSER